MKKDLIFIATLLTISLLTVGSCAVKRHSNRKCDGRKAIQTPMGKM